MKSVLKYFQFLLILLLFNSCAVHAEFPFICFRAECVKDQWTFNKIKKPDGKALRKRMQVQTKVLKRKLKSNQNSRNKTGSIARNEKENEKGSAVIYTRFILLFAMKGDTCFSDTMIISYTEEFRNIQETDQSRLIYYIEHFNPGKIKQIVVREIITKETDFYEPFQVTRRRYRIINKFLRYEGVSPTKIKVIYRNSKALE